MTPAGLLQSLSLITGVTCGNFFLRQCFKKTDKFQGYPELNRGTKDSCRSLPHTLTIQLGVFYNIVGMPLGLFSQWACLLLKRDKKTNKILFYVSVKELNFNTDLFKAHSQRPKLLSQKQGQVFHFMSHAGIMKCSLRLTLVLHVSKLMIKLKPNKPANEHPKVL